VVPGRCRGKLITGFNKTQYNIPQVALFPVFFWLFMPSIFGEAEFFDDEINR
jgi:hypothetical protein